MIVFPMAGGSTRFFNAGYNRPKYMLPLWGRTVFEQVLLSFRAQFNRESFLFVHRDEPGVKDFITEAASMLGLRGYETYALRNPTRGQAETVALGLSKHPSQERLTIFNIDTLKYDSLPSSICADCEGEMELFAGTGDHWSFACLNEFGFVTRTAEKVRISSWCSNGLYHFSSPEVFLSAYAFAASDASQHSKELYIAPLYNHLLNLGGKVRGSIVNRSRIGFCGTPAEYQELSKYGSAETRE